MHHEIIEYPGKEGVYLECFVLDSGIRLGQEEKRPAVIVCPGGGYVYLSRREGEPVAMAYAAKGFHAFVLHYSIRYAAAGYAPQKELDQAVGLIRERAEEWQIAEDKIFTCGFSAGGHLAMSQALFGTNRPDGMILGYPAVSMKAKEAGFMLQLLAGKQTPDAEDLKYADLPAQVTQEAPPLFVFTTAQDTLTYQASLELASAYAAHGLPCELHIFQKGPHGYALANAASADGAASNLNSAVEQWLDLSAKWLIDVTGGLQFADISTSHIMDAIAEMGIRPDAADAGAGNGNDVSAEKADSEETVRTPEYFIVYTEENNMRDGTFISSVTAIGEKPDGRQALDEMLIDFAEEDGSGELDWDTDEGYFGKGGITAGMEILELKATLAYSLCDNSDLEKLGITFEKLEQIFRDACEDAGFSCDFETGTVFAFTNPQSGAGRTFSRLRDSNPVTYAELIRDLVKFDIDHADHDPEYQERLRRFLRAFTGASDTLRQL